MATYNTKFNLNDVAYIVDSNALNIIPVTIIAIHLSETLTKSVEISYAVRFSNAYLSGKSNYTEDSIKFLEEAKAEVTQLLSERASQIANLG